jgi:CubicO group peptidase (beta-lactamase class C family)
MNNVQKLMQDGLARGVFPGAVLQVVADGKTVFKEAYGVANLFSGRPMTLDTFFDLASLTKPLATVLAIMVLADRGQLGLDHSIGDVYPELFGRHKAGITVRQLLTHSSGLPPWRPYFMRLQYIAQHLRLETLRKWLVAEPLASDPGEHSDYSDLGFMFLQWIVEAVSGQALDQFVTSEVFIPLGIEALFYNDSTKAIVDTHPYAATQLCPWRNQLMLGQVDDDNAYVTGGVAGHAGLFGKVDAVCRLLQELLAADHGDTRKGVFDPNLVRLFFTASENNRWALGFDTPSPQGSSAGQYFSRHSVGHLGFTGTSFWMDRRKGVIVSLLTNRVHPWRYSAGIKTFRPCLHDAVMTAL